MEKRYIISPEQLMKAGFIHQNTEATSISPIILRVQDRIIQSILGTKLYKKCLDLIQAYNNGNAPTTPVPEPYKNLLNNFVIDCLVCYVEMETTTFITWKMRAAGVGQNNDQWFKPSSKQETTDLKKQIEVYAVHYRNQLLAHLEWSLTNGTDGAKLYPEYECGQGVDAGIDPQKKKTTIAGNFLFIKGGH